MLFLVVVLCVIVFTFGYTIGTFRTEKMAIAEIERMGAVMRSDGLKAIEDLDVFYRAKLKEMDEYYRDILKKNGLIS